MPNHKNQSYRKVSTGRMMKFLLVLGVIWLTPSNARKIYVRPTAPPVVERPSDPTQVPCQSRTTFSFTMTADDIFELYADGTKLTGPWEINMAPDTTEIPCDANVIAVHGKNYPRGQKAAILGSSEGGYIVTDSSWKCSNVSQPGWETVDFDDSDWSPAKQYAANTVCGWHPIDNHMFYNCQAGISRKAYWIWLRQWNGGSDNASYEAMDAEVFCRKTFNMSHLVPTKITPVLLCQTKPSFQFSATVDDWMSLYIDGVELDDLPNADKHNEADTVELKCDTRLIAIHGRNFPGYGGAGIIASADDDYIVSDRSWKCTNVSYPGWETVGYNDSFWPNAYVFGSNSRYGIWHHGLYFASVPGISMNARWIWLRQWSGKTDSNYEEMDGEIFCRKTLYVDPSLNNSASTELGATTIEPSCKSKNDLKFTIAADDSMKLFVDGVAKINLLYATNSRKPDTVEIPCDAKVIAVHGRNNPRGEKAGILASSEGDFILTDSSWRCSNVSYPAWQGVYYNDSFWSPAMVYGSNGKFGGSHEGVFFPGIRSISFRASWIWLRQWNGWRNSTYKEMDSEVFCRKDLRSLDLCAKTCRDPVYLGQSNPSMSSGTSVAVSNIFLGISIIAILILAFAVYVLYRRTRQHPSEAPNQSRRSQIESVNVEYLHDRYPPMDDGDNPPVVSSPHEPNHDDSDTFQLLQNSM